MQQTVAAPVPFAAAQTAAQPVGVQTASVQPATGAAPTSEPQRRRRRTRAEIDAANGAQAPAPQQTVIPPQQPTTQTAGPFSSGIGQGYSNPPTAVVGQQQPAVQPAAQPNNFGMQAGVAPNPEIEAALADIFGK